MECVSTADTDSVSKGASKDLEIWRTEFLASFELAHACSGSFL
jgi:hypothetical protein